MLSKEGSSTIFWVFSMTRPGIESRSPRPLANTLTIMQISRKYILVSPWTFQLTLEYIYIYIYIYTRVSWRVDQDTLVKYDQIKLISQHSPPCCLSTCSLGVAVLRSHWLKNVINSRYDIIIRSFRLKIFFVLFGLFLMAYQPSWVM